MQSNAATFEAAAPPPNTFLLDGIDYSREGLAKLQQQAAAEAAGTSTATKRKGGISGSGGGGSNEQGGMKALLKSIGQEWQQKQEEQQLRQRQRQERLMDVDGYQVLKSNNYSFAQGGISAWTETRGGPMAAALGSLAG